MQNYIHASHEYAMKHRRNAGEHKFNVPGTKIYSNNPVYVMPVLPFSFGNDFEMYLDGNGRFLVESRKCVLRYFGIDSKLTSPPLRVFNSESSYVYDEEEANKLISLVEAEAIDASGEYLGSFEVNAKFFGAIRLLSRVTENSKTHRVIRQAISKYVYMRIASNLNELQGGVNLYIEGNTKFPPEYGGFGDMTINATGGELTHEIELMLKYSHLSALYKLVRFGRCGANVRITRSITNPSEAVLVWSSPVWEGTALTTAEIVS